MSEVSKIEKTLEVALSDSVRSTGKVFALPEKVIMFNTDIPQNVFFLKETFNPLLISYADFIHCELYGNNLFNVDYLKSKTGSTLFGISVEEKTEKDESFKETPNSVKVLFLMESLNNLMPPDLSLSKMDSFYSDLAYNIAKKTYDLPEGAKINLSKNLSDIYRDVMYANIINLGYKLNKKNT